MCVAGEGGVMAIDGWVFPPAWFRVFADFVGRKREDGVRETDRQTDRDTERERHRQRAETETERQTDRETETER